MVVLWPLGWPKNSSAEEPMKSIDLTVGTGHAQNGISKLMKKGEQALGKGAPAGWYPALGSAPCGCYLLSRTTHQTCVQSKESKAQRI